MYCFKDQVLTDLFSSTVCWVTCLGWQANVYWKLYASFCDKGPWAHRSVNRTGHICQSSTYSAVKQHAQVCNVPMRQDHFIITDVCERFELHILESSYTITLSNSKQCNVWISFTNCLIWACANFFIIFCRIIVVSILIISHYKTPMKTL